MSKPTRATRFLHEAADRCRNGDVTIECDSAYSTVAIDAPGHDGIFMQGDEADEFIAEVDALCKSYPSLDRDTAELALAEPYAECCFN
jgi:hypothetical protein